MSQGNDILTTDNIVPNLSPQLIQQIEQVQDQATVNALKAVVRDIEEYKKSLLGIVRRGDNMLYIYNFPTQTNTNIVEAMRMDKYGNFAFGTEYPRWPRAKVDVNGPLYAIPQWGLWSQTVELAGNGLYTWDTEVYNPNSDIYTRATANTQIRIDEPGTYEITFNVFAHDVAAATAAPIIWELRVNTVVQAGIRTALCTDDIAATGTCKLVTINRGDLVDINLAAPATAARLGTASVAITWLLITKVN